jgi:hypothetical protein
MIPLRSRSLATGLVVVLAACGSSDAPAKPARLHGPPLTPDLVATRGERQSEYYERQVILINKWIRQSGMSADTSSLLQVVRESRDQSGRARRLNVGDLVVGLKKWLGAAQGGGATRTGAAYLVGDGVLRLAWRPFDLSNPTLDQDARDALKTMGVETFYSEAAAEVSYPGSWLRAAVEADPTGPMGQRAELLLIETDCAGGNTTAAYHSIIARLDSLVASPADSEVRMTAQILEADAYRDIVALAHGLGGSNADSTKFAAEAAEAKTKALPLYDAALATDSTSRLARGAQLARDRLASGQPLDHTRFFCFGE